MLRVALTGGMATGKSYVAARLSEAGVPVIDADVLSREVVSLGTPGFGAVVERFGHGVLAGDGSLDRRRLADIVFRDASARRDLEAIVHPAVRAAIDRFWLSLPASTPFAVADIPLLFETNRVDEFDAVVVAACPRETQIQRIMRRDGATREQAERRLAAQLPIDEKVRRAEYVVDTSATFAATDRQVDDLRRALAVRAGSS